jgi:carbon storage regulator
MLVLTRRIGEQLVIDGNIVVTIVAIEGNKIRLGVQAPPAIRVDREEVHARRLADQTGTAVRKTKREFATVAATGPHA